MSIIDHGTHDPLPFELGSWAPVADKVRESLPNASAHRAPKAMAFTHQLTLPGAVMDALDLRLSLVGASFAASVTLPGSRRTLVTAWCNVRDVAVQEATPNVGPCLFLGPSDSCIELTEDAASALRQWLVNCRTQG